MLLAPFIVSIIEFVLLQRQTEADIQQRYERTPDNQIIVFVPQGIILVLVFTPLLLRVFFRAVVRATGKISSVREQYVEREKWGQVHRGQAEAPRNQPPVKHR